MNIDSESDFLMNLQFTDEDGNSIPIPIFNFKIEYFVRDKTITVEHKDGAYIVDEFTKVNIEDDTLIISYDGPKLELGNLRSRKTYYLPNDKFVDGKQTIIEESITNYTMI